MAGGCCRARPTGSRLSAGSERDTGTAAAKHSPGRAGRLEPAGTEGREVSFIFELQVASQVIIYRDTSPSTLYLCTSGHIWRVLPSHLLLVIVAVIVDAAVEAVAGHHPLLLHQALEAMLGPTVGVTHHLHQAGNHAAHVPVVCLCNDKAGGAKY